MHYNYLIIGGGMTADAAVQGIREVDTKGSIGLISKETNPPYDRPPLTKGLWKGKAKEEIWRGTEDLGVELHLNCKAQILDPENKRVTDTEQNSYTFDKLLLATGGTPRKLPFGNDQIIYFRTVKDFERLQSLAQEKKRFAVIGGGFIGSEIAAALAMNDQDVVMIFPEAGIGALNFPPGLSSFLNDYYREKGVEVLAGGMVNGLTTSGDRLALQTESSGKIVADTVVAGIGIKPNTALAETAGLEVSDQGIVVDKSLRTSHPDIFAAGDVASFYNLALGKRLRVEHEDNANTMGKTAGQAMAGEDVVYDYLPYFYSDLFDLGYEAVGELNPDLETVADWQEPYRKGVIYYLSNERQVRGVILWNVWDQIDAARELISQPGPFKAKDLKGRLK